MAESKNWSAQSAESARSAEPVRPPKQTRALERANEANRRYVRERERIEFNSVMRGLIVLAVIVALGSMARAGLDRVFVPGWWRQW